MRSLYTTVTALALPFVFAHLWWRGRKLPGYRHRWWERLGRFSALNSEQPLVWVHAVSVGETIAATGLIQRILDSGRAQVLVTTSTPTGAERVRSAFGERVLHVYAPYDLPWIARAFLQRTRPALAVVMETEIWPNMLAACAEQQIPVILANARLSERSARGYARFKRTTSRMLSCLTAVAAQHPDDGQRFLKLGLPHERLCVTGSIKFDIQVDEKLQQQAAALKEVYSCGGRRTILMAASTHDGEEAQLLDAFDQVLRQHPNALLLLVPRHPDRFEAVARLVGERYNMARRSTALPPEPDTQLVLGDTMGEMMLLYGASDIVFMGGSFISRGGHNMIEPAAWGLPIMSGPNVFNFADISERLEAAGGLVTVRNGGQWADQVNAWLDDEDERRRVGAIAQQFAASNRGALNRLMELVLQHLPDNPGSDAQG